MKGYYFSERDQNNRSTLTINGRKVGRIHFCKSGAWLNPGKVCKLKSKAELEKLGFSVKYDSSNKTYPIKVYMNTQNEDEIAKRLEKAFLDVQ